MGTRRFVIALAVVVVVLTSKVGMAPAVAHADGSFDAALFSLLNQDRVSHGLPPVQQSPVLGGLAESTRYGGCGYSISGRAEDMVRRNYFSHTILACGGQTMLNVLRAEGVPYTAAAENLGWVNAISDPAAAARWVNDHFMASPAHRANILDPAYTTAAIGSWWTSPGQTWSGAGPAVTNAIVVAEEFTNGPRTAASAPPPAVPAQPAPSAPHPMAAVATHLVAPTPAPGSALPPATAIAAPVLHARMAAITSVAPSRVSAKIRKIAPVPAGGAGGVAAAVWALGLLAAIGLRRTLRGTRGPR